MISNKNCILCPHRAINIYTEYCINLHFATFVTLEIVFLYILYKKRVIFLDFMLHTDERMSKNEAKVLAIFAYGAIIDGVL